MLRFAIVFLIVTVGFAFSNSMVFAETFYVDVDGDDANSGSITQPFASIMRAQESVQPGDTVCIRGGIYRMQESQIAKSERIFAHVIRLY